MGHLRGTFVVIACALVFGAFGLHPLSDAFIDHINSKQTTWKAGRNFPYNTPLKHLKKLLGVLPHKGVSIPQVKHDAVVISKLPESFDTRVEWPNCPSIREIRDQGSCGSCWAFAAVEAMTDRVCIFSNGSTQFHFSADDLISCCDDCGGGCHGGYPDEAWEYWKKHGIVSGGNYNSSEGCRPYSTPPCVHHAPGHKVNATGNFVPCLEKYRENPKCLKTCDKSYGVAYQNDKLYGKKIISIFDGEKHIMSEIFLNGPVQAVFLVKLDFFNYKSGVYIPVDEGEPVGGHAVKIIGWGVENATKFWLAANSWNSGWGDNGFFKIRRGKNDCGIETYIVTGQPLLTNE